MWFVLIGSINFKKPLNEPQLKFTEHTSVALSIFFAKFIYGPNLDFVCNRSLSKWSIVVEKEKHLLKICNTLSFSIYGNSFCKKVDGRKKILRKK
jgi:hypothetical protein